MKKSIIAIVIAASAFAANAFAVEGGNHSEVIKSVIGEVNNAKADHNNYHRAFEVVQRRLGLNEQDAGNFVNQVFATGTYKEQEPAQEEIVITATTQRATAATVETVSAPAATDSEAPRGNNEATAVQASEATAVQADIKDQQAATVTTVSKAGGDAESYDTKQKAAVQQTSEATAKTETALQVNGVDGKDGKDGATGKQGKAGVNGSNGKDGVTTTITKTVVDNETRATVLSHSRAINRNSAAIERNSKAIERNTKQIAANTKAIKQVGAMAQATSNLHYNASNSGYAVAVGEYKGAVAFAGGVQKQINEHTAVTVQVSYDGDSVGASVGIHGDF